MKQSVLISQLMNQSQQFQERAEEILDLPLDQLTKRPNSKAWNTLEVFEHLNYYVDIYNEFISEALNKTRATDQDLTLKSGYWGKKFITMMKPTAKGIKKMNTFKSKNPMGLNLTKNSIQHFIESNKKLMKQIEGARGKDLSRVKCKLALPLLKIKLADAMAFLVAHNERHFLQIENTLQ